ncbi:MULTISPECIES: peptidoglycan-binding domain-containing protein [unclassified Streptomyces]|uniref:peptidoglycan-binding domain-containing protein n=1 Tax=unclassified Streptomyces TaxID=2593676 RepID=UPI002E788293|nr:peptidoglycan-binding domain-containing protein [Streptomyces sp. JV176]MEE1804000.1 peptidoglycan-binding domain-containing protein [Streptomyces sp. JV176]
MNVRRNIALAATVAAFSGLAVAGPATGAFASSQGERAQTAVSQEAGVLAACPKGEYAHKALAGGVRGWTANYSNTMTAVIGVGNSGNHVTEAQCMLVGWGFDPKGVDGVFGAGTAAAVKKFQSDQKISADGVVGKNTWSRLRNPK